MKAKIIELNDHGANTIIFDDEEITMEQYKRFIAGASQFNDTLKDEVYIIDCEKVHEFIWRKPNGLIYVSTFTFEVNFSTECSLILAE